MFIKVGKTNGHSVGLFSVDNPVQPKIVVISPAHHVLQAVLRFMVPDEAEKGQAGKTQFFKGMMIRLH